MHAKSDYARQYTVQDNMTAPLLMNALQSAVYPCIYAKEVKPALGLLRARVFMDQTLRVSVYAWVNCTLQSIR